MSGDLYVPDVNGPDTVDYFTRKGDQYIAEITDEVDTLVKYPHADAHDEFADDLLRFSAALDDQARALNEQSARLTVAAAELTEDDDG